MNRVIGQGGFLPAERATEAYLEMRYDRRTGRATTTESAFTIEGSDVFPLLEQTVTEEYVAYADPVDVQVPEDVKDNAN